MAAGGNAKIELRKFLKLFKTNDTLILIPVDTIVAIEEDANHCVRVTFLEDEESIRHVFVKESIQDIIQGNVFIML